MRSCGATMTRITRRAMIARRRIGLALLLLGLGCATAAAVPRPAYSYVETPSPQWMESHTVAERQAMANLMLTTREERRRSRQLVRRRLVPQRSHRTTVRSGWER